jgi:predicted nucleic acid-binding protein
MNKVAVDTNIMLYALDDFYADKQNISIEIIADKTVLLLTKS